MTLATACLSLACVAACAAFQNNPPLACNINAIRTAERPRYNDLVKQLRIAIQGQSEVSDGYVYRVDTKKITLAEVAEWITMERLCCPFLTFQLNVNASGDSQLTLRGPEGAKAVLREEFPADSK